MRMISAENISTTAFMLLGALLIGGCAAHMPRPEPRLAEIGPLDRAILVTDGVEIEVMDPDGTMPERIVAGEPFRPARFSPHTPKVQEAQVDDLDEFDRRRGYYGIARAWHLTTSSSTPPLVRNVIPGSPAAAAGLGEGDGVYLMKADGRELATYQELYAVFSKYDDNLPDRDIPVGERHLFAACGSFGSDQDSCPDRGGVMEAAAQPRPYRVLVHVAGRENPLYGRLAFFHVYSTADGSASRVYRLVVPQKYIDRARGGNVSVVYQPYEAKYRSPFSGEVRTEEDSRVSWALWLSDVPF